LTNTAYTFIKKESINVIPFIPFVAILYAFLLCELDVQQLSTYVTNGML